METDFTCHISRCSRTLYSKICQSDHLNHLPDKGTPRQCHKPYCFGIPRMSFKVNLVICLILKLKHNADFKNLLFDLKLHNITLESSSIPQYSIQSHELIGDNHPQKTSMIQASPLEQRDRHLTSTFEQPHGASEIRHLHK